MAPSGMPLRATQETVFATMWAEVGAGRGVGVGSGVGGGGGGGVDDGGGGAATPAAPPTVGKKAATVAALRHVLGIEPDTAPYALRLGETAPRRYHDPSAGETMPSHHPTIPSPHLTSPHLTPPHLTSPHLASPAHQPPSTCCCRWHRRVDA